MDESVPTISVCILNYNYGHYLPQAIDSCLRQEPGQYRLAEILVIDDGSTDNSHRICDTYGDRIRLIARPHEGFPATLTASVSEANGDWIAFLDADDWFTSDKLSTASHYLRRDVLMVRHFEYVVDSHGELLIDGPHPGGNTSTLLVRRDAALSLLPVTNELYFHVLADFGFGVDITAPLTFYRVHDSNMTDRVNPGVFCDYLYRVTDGLAARLTQLTTEAPEWFTTAGLRRLAWHYRAVAMGHLVEANLQRGRRGKALRHAATEIFYAAAAFRAWPRHAASIRHVLTGKPQRRLEPAPASRSEAAS